MASRGTAHLFCEPLIRDIAVGVFDVEATYVGALPTGLTRPRANYHPAMDDLSSEEIFASSGGPSICRVVDLRDRKYVIVGARNVTFVDVERGRVVETIERDDDLVCSAAEHAVVATITKAGRFEVWNVEPPILIESAELPSDPDAISVGPRHVVVKYTDGLLVRPRPPAR